MSAGDAYVERVSRKLAGMDRRVREDVLRELRSHVADAVATDGQSAIASMEAPEAVATRYRDLYGYGVAYRALFVALAATLAVLTVPVLLYAGVGVLAALTASLVALLVLVAYLMFVAVRAGSRTGAVAGLAAFAVRVAAVLALEAPALQVVRDPMGWATFLAVSVGLVAIGFLPGRAKERWRPREVTL